MLSVRSLNIIKCQSFYVPLFQCFTHMFKLQFKLLMLFSAARKRYIEMFCRFVQTTVLRKDLFGFNFLYKVVLWAKDFDGKNLFHISRHIGRNFLFTTTSRINWLIFDTLCLINETAEFETVARNVNILIWNRMSQI